MSSSQVIENYESLAALTGRMREAAASGQWDSLIGIEQLRSKLLGDMKPLDAAITLEEAARQRKDELIARILADDAEIRSLTQAWMDQLQLSLQSIRQEQRLQQAYGA